MPTPKDQKVKKSRCWAGYEPTPGVPAYAKGSCRKITDVKSHVEMVKELNRLISQKTKEASIKIRDFIKKHSKTLESKAWENDPKVPFHLKLVSMYKNHNDEKAKSIIESISLSKKLFGENKISL